MLTETLTKFFFILKIMNQIHGLCPRPNVIPLTEPQGVITSNNFPDKFPTPYCNHWVIDSGNATGKEIRVHLTQVYLIENLTFVAYEDYPFYSFENEVSGDYSSEKDNTVRKQSSNSINTSRRKEPIPVPNGVHKFKMVSRAFSTTHRYFAIQVEVYTPYATHYRARNFLNVYGFNMTYEIVDTKGSSIQSARNYQCSLRNCSFAGHCFVSEDYRRFYCQCLPGRSGEYCEYNDRCDPSQNINFCLNGGKCRALATGVGVCFCPSGYTGPHCENRENGSVKECPGPGCEELCDETGLVESNRPCHCHSGKVMPDSYVRYEVTLQSSNTNLPLWELRSSTLSTMSSEVKQLKRKLEIAIKRKLVYLSGNENISVSVVSFQPASKFSFQFLWPGEFNSSSLQRNLTGTTFYLPYEFHTGAHFHLSTYPALSLKVLNKTGPDDPDTLKVGQDFSITCIAQGSQRIRFKWFKDDLPLEPTLALRVITSLKFTQRNESTSIIIFDSATFSDKGTFTCQVSDMGEEQCKDIQIEVMSLPVIEVEPMSLTLRKGDQDHVILCTTENEKPDHNYIYSWLKNGVIVWGERDSNEIIEKLDPYGSLLRIVRAEADAIYTCVVTNNAGRNSTNIDVKVLESINSDACRAERYLKLSWSRTGAGQIAKIKCPSGYIGFVQRNCEMIENSNGRRRAVWGQVDFSHCVSYEIREMNRSIQNMKMGFTSRLQPLSLTKSLVQNLENRVVNQKLLHTGEGDRIISLLLDIGNYALQRTNALGDDNETFLQDYFNATSILLQFHGSCTNEGTIIALSQLIHKLFVPPNNTYTPKFFRSNELVVEIAMMRYTALRLEFQDWLNIVVEIPNHGAKNHGSNISFIAFRNLTALAATRSTSIIEHETSHTLVSPIVSVLAPPPYGIYDKQDHLRFLFNISKHLAEKISNKEMNITCATLNDRPEKGIIWKLDACTFFGIINNVTVECDCYDPQIQQIALLVSSMNHEDEIVSGGLHWCAVLGIVISIIILVGLVFFKISINISLHKGKRPSLSNSSIKLNRTMTNTSNMTDRTNLTSTTGISSQITQQLDYSPKHSRSRSSASCYSSSNYSKTTFKPEKCVCLLRESDYVPPSGPPSIEDIIDKPRHSAPLSIPVASSSEGYLDLKTPVSKVGFISYPEVPTTSHELFKQFQISRSASDEIDKQIIKEHVYSSIDE